VVALPSALKEAETPMATVVTTASPVVRVRPRSRWVRPIAGVGLGVAVAAGAMVVVSMHAPDRRPLMKLASPPPPPALAAPEPVHDEPVVERVIAERAPAQVVKPRPKSPPKSVVSGKAKPPPVEQPSDPDGLMVGEPPVPKPLSPPPSAGSDAPSLDQLMQEAGEPKAAPPPKPTTGRSELSAADIKRGMAVAEARAKTCFAGSQGMAQLQLSVAPTGRVARVSLFGPFASTPVGVCIERAVRAAVFPPWDGAPQSFRYNFLLAD
jgi:hypothetical protein